MIVYYFKLLYVLLAHLHRHKTPGATIYMYRMQTAPGNQTISDKTAYQTIYDEIFLGFGKSVDENVFDQSRFAILPGYRFNKKFRLEGDFVSRFFSWAGR